MRSKGADGLGCFSEEFEVANNEYMAAKIWPWRGGSKFRRREVRRQTIRGILDCGAARLVLPEAVVKQLSLPLGGKIKVRYTEGRRAIRPVARDVSVNSWGATDNFR